MVDTGKDNTKSANQAWRRKPRQFAPKSKAGCKTCKIRRVKCDLGRPSCLKCTSTGRKCDGYSEPPPNLVTEVPVSHMDSATTDGLESIGSYRYSGTTVKKHHCHQHGKIKEPIQHLAPFMIIPATGPAETEALCFFEYHSIKHMNEYLPCESWRNTLMYFCRTEPAVRHAAIALGLINRRHMDRGPDKQGHRSQQFIDWQPDEMALLHYNRAIQYLLSRKVGDSIEHTAVTLLVCYLFNCFDHLAGNDVQALKHLRGGVELSRNIRNKAPDGNDMFDDAPAWGASAIIFHITRQIRRLDMQAVLFLVDWTPSVLQETPIPRLPEEDGAFKSLYQAVDYLQMLVAQVMELRNSCAEQPIFPSGKTLPIPPWSFKDIVLGQLDTWSTLFENMLQRDKLHEEDPDRSRLISLLRLRHITAWTCLSSYGPGREMEHDKFLPQFQRCIVLADEVAAAHERYAGSSKPTFTPEIGLLPMLYLIGVKCRHPVVRREALRILRRQPMREAVWDSVVTARVLERVIEIEENGLGDVIQSMDEITMWQRVENISWSQNPGNIKFSYTFCALEGLHIETLAI